MIDYLVGPQPLLRISLAGNTFPSRKSVTTSSAFTGANPHVPFFVSELSYTREALAIVGAYEIDAVLNTMYMAAVTGKSSAADAIAASVPQVQAILAKYAADL